MVTNRCVLVTGASGGVGKGIALACGEAGWTVWIAARRASEGEETAQAVTDRGGKGHFASCDVADEASVADTVAHTIRISGALHGIVHNATSGFSPKPGRLHELTTAEIEDHIAVSLRGAYLLARYGYEHLKATQGAYLLLTSEAGFEGKARLPAYAAVKAAQRGLARALAREWGPDNIRVNCIAPLANTPALERAFRLDPAMSARVLGRNPMGRLGDAEIDIGRAARFFLGPDSAYVTGHTLMIDGGSCPVT